MLNRTIAKFLFYGVAVVLLAWTSSLTYSFLDMALPGTFWLVPLLGLVVFDVGMIAWMFVFLSHAEGAIQRAVAIILTLFNFVGVGLMTISEILLSGQTMAAAPEMLGTVAVWSVGIWTTINVLGVIVFHLGDNNARRAMAYQTEKDAIFDAALKDLNTRRVAAQKELSETMSAAMMNEMRAELSADVDGDGRLDMLERPGSVGKPTGKNTQADTLHAGPPILPTAEFTEDEIRAAVAMLSSARTRATEVNGTGPGHNARPM